MLDFRYKVMASVSRFIVPFEYKGDFDIKKEFIDESRDFVRMTEDDSENYNLYDYVFSEFRAEKGSSYEKTRLGLGYRISEEGLSQTPDLVTFVSVNNNNELKEVKIEIVDAGIYIFKNGLGIFWYELSGCWGEWFDNVVLNNFLHKNRELSFIENISHSGIDSQLWEHYPMENELALFCTGEWVEKIVNNNLRLEAVFLSSLKYSYEREYAKFEQIWENLPISAQYKIKRSALVSSKGEVPHVAQIINYAVFDAQEDFRESREGENSRRQISQAITNGYSSDYMLVVGEELDIKKPFSNVYWNASTEGTSFLVWYNGKEDDSFLERAIAKRGYFKNDYFTMYIKALFQSFSLMIYSSRIQNQIDPSDENSEKCISEIEEGINLFLVKSFATSVSHVYQQNEYYNYIQEKLRIKDDVASTTKGMQALHEILLGKVRQREERQEKRTEVALGLVSFFAIVSAFTDTISLFGQIVNGEYRVSLEVSVGLFVIELLTVGIIAVVGGYAIVETFRAFIKDITRR